MLVMAFGININQAVNISNEAKSKAQASVETAVKSLNSQGSLGNASVQSFVNEYHIQDHAKSGQAKNATSGTSDSSATASKQCSTMEIDGVKHQMPYMIVKLGTERGKNKVASNQIWTIEGTTNTVPTKSLNNVKYKVISATVYSANTNTFSFPGVPACQLHKSEVSAIAFGSNSDTK